MHLSLWLLRLFLADPAVPVHSLASRASYQWSKNLRSFNLAAQISARGPWAIDDVLLDGNQLLYLQLCQLRGSPNANLQPKTPSLHLSRAIRRGLGNGGNCFTGWDADASTW